VREMDTHSCMNVREMDTHSCMNVREMDTHHRLLSILPLLLLPLPILSQETYIKEKRHLSMKQMCER